MNLIEQIKAAEAAATKGTWIAEQLPEGLRQRGCETLSAVMVQVGKLGDVKVSLAENLSAADADLIVLLRNNLPAFLEMADFIAIIARFTSDEEMGGNRLPAGVPPAVEAAFRHVQQFHPEVTQVMYSGTCQWLYCTDDFKAPDFDGSDIDVGLLEDAADAVPSFPAAYYFGEVHHGHAED